MPAFVTYVPCNGHGNQVGRNKAARQRVVGWLQRCFVPSGRPFRYAVGLGLLWFSPLFFFGTYLTNMFQGIGNHHTSLDSIIFCTVCGLLAGFSTAGIIFTSLARRDS